jgi:riboflavin kinase/FMN adenylyltransferase
MELIRGLSQLRHKHRGCVATIGNFDGVHRGHQAILQQLKMRAEFLHIPTTVVIFEPQPFEFFAPQESPARLTRLREKILAMQRYAVDRILSIRFDEEFAHSSAIDFIDKVLIDGLQVRHLVIGDDFCFGQKRSGNFAILQESSAQHGFTIESQPTFMIGNERVSSTRIRNALARGDLAESTLLLGRPYTLCGRVRRGEQFGRQIGFPTTNIFLYRRISPLTGVFAARMYGVEDKPLSGVANLGMRPTVGGDELLLEVHLFDFNKFIYGKYVEVEFVEKIRDEQRFSSIDALKNQIETDVERAKSILMKF